MESIVTILNNYISKLSEYDVKITVNYQYLIYDLYFELNSSPIHIKGTAEVCCHYLQGMLYVYESWLKK